MKKKILILLVVVLALVFVGQIFAPAPVNARDGSICFKEWYSCPGPRCGQYVEICCIYINHVLRCKAMTVPNLVN
ncbi:MAG TPA: hypothetical protein VGB16_00080 [candidate division Zixibacteria bacterium]